MHVRCMCVPPLPVLLGSLLGSSSMESLGLEKFFPGNSGVNEPKFYSLSMLHVCFNNLSVFFFFTDFE